MVRIDSLEPGALLAAASELEERARRWKQHADDAFHPAARNHRMRYFHTLMSVVHALRDRAACCTTAARDPGSAA